MLGSQRSRDRVRLGALGVLALFVGVLGLDAGHYAFVLHERCLEHQEIVHGDGHTHGLSANGLDRHGLRDNDKGDDGHEHELCVLAVFSDPAPLTDPTTASVILPLAGPDRLGAGQGWYRPTQTPLQVAPKNSPPS